jgi:predicted permease
VALRRLFVGDTSALDVVADWRTLGAATAAAFLSAIATGIAPVLFTGRDDLAATLKSGARDGTYQRSNARAALLVIQGALSVALLVGAALFVRSLNNVRGLRLGYDIDPVLLVRWERRGTPIDSAGVATLRHRLLETALARPDVERGAWVNNAVFASGTTILNLAVPGIDSVSRLGRFTYEVSSADYFSTIGTRIIRGRSFTDADRVGRPGVVVVSDAMAAALWPGRDALGACVKISWRSPRADTMPCTTVIGVAENAVHDPVADYPLRYYLPEEQHDFGARWLLLRMRRDPAAAAEDVRRALQALMPGQSLVTAHPARDLVDAKGRSWLVGATMFACFGVLALLVAGVGLYGVIAYTVAQRRHELGVRIALGAQARDVVRLVVGQGISFAMTGVAVGLAVALLAGKWIQPLLFKQSARDPLMYAGVSALIVLVAIVASAVPAFRATRADPNTALRSD